MAATSLMSSSPLRPTNDDENVFFSLSLEAAAVSDARAAALPATPVIVAPAPGGPGLDPTTAADVTAPDSDAVVDVLATAADVVVAVADDDAPGASVIVKEMGVASVEAGVVVLSNLTAPPTAVTLAACCCCAFVCCVQTSRKNVP